MYQPKVYRKQGGNEIVVKSGGKITIESGGLIKTALPGEVTATGLTTVDSYSGVHQTVFTFVNKSITMTDAAAAGCHGSQKLMDFPAGMIQVLGAAVDLTIAAGAGGITDTAAVVGSLGTATVGVGNATLTGDEADIVPSTAATLTAGAGAFEAITSPATGSTPSIAALTDNTTGTASDTLAALPVLADAPATADALRDDINTNLYPVLLNAFASLAAKFNAILGLFRIFDGTATAKDLYLNFAVPDAGSTASDTLTVNGTVTITWANLGDK